MHGPIFLRSTAVDVIEIQCQQAVIATLHTPAAVLEQNSIPKLGVTLPAFCLDGLRLFGITAG